MKLTVGSRRQVWNGTAKKTSGGLTKKDLIMSHGHIVSRSKHNSAKKEMRLLKYGYGTQKGKFGFVKVGKRKSRKQRGGSYASVNDGYMLKNANPDSSYWDGTQGSASWSGDGGRKHRRRHRHRGGSHALTPASI